jgi:prefoldin subunit 5
MKPKFFSKDSHNNGQQQLFNTLESLNTKIEFLTSKEDDLSSTFAFISESFARLESKLDKMTIRQSDSQKSFVQNVMEKLDYLFFDNQLAKKQLMLEEDLRHCADEIDSIKSSLQSTISEINDAILHINEKLPKAPATKVQ